MGARRSAPWALRRSSDPLTGRQLVYLGDGNNVAASLMLAGASLGLHVRVIGPAGYAPDSASAVDLVLSLIQAPRPAPAAAVGQA